MRVTLKSFDYVAIDRALGRFAGNSRRGAAAVLKAQARLLVRDVVKITPPNKNSKNNRAGGNRAIANDVRKVFRPGRNAPPADAAEYERQRNRRGRVGRGLGGSKIAVSDLTAFIRERQKSVGILASGWNAAAQKLGLKLPEWIARHGTRRGAAKVRLTGDVLEVEIRNAVKFGGDVSGLFRRVQWALYNRARQMEKQLADYEAKKAARAAGLSTR